MWTLHSLLNAGVLSDMPKYMQHSMLGLSIKKNQASFSVAWNKHESLNVLKLSLIH